MDSINSALSQMRRTPILWWLPVSLTLVARVSVFVFTAQARRVTPGDLGWVGLVMFALVFATPAIASGYNAVVGRAVRGEPAGMGAFASNLGTYYWRIVGGLLLMVLTTLPVILLTGGGAQAYTWAADPRSRVFSAILMLFGEVWFAVIVLSGTGVLEGVGRGLRALIANFADYAWPLALLFVTTWVVPLLLPGRPPVDMGSGLITPTATEMVTDHVVGVLACVVGAVVRVAVFQVYHTTAPDQVAALGPPSAPPHEPPYEPPYEPPAQA